MIKVRVFYRNEERGRFDINYYCSKHIPLFESLLKPALKSVAVEEGIAGQVPGSPAPFLAMGHLYFDYLEAFQSVFGQHARAILDDVPNYTNVQPTIQISRVKLPND